MLGRIGREANRESTGPKLLLFITEDWVFWSHRLPLARAAIEAGYDVTLLTNVGSYGALIESVGVHLIPLALKRRSINPLRELSTVWRIVRIYRSMRPDIVHHVAMKPVLYGSIAAFLCGVPLVVNALTGMGYLFISRTFKANILRSVVIGAFRVLLGRGRSRIIVQNRDDVDIVILHGMAAATQVDLIKGAGVSVTVFEPTPEHPPPVTVVLPARMLRDKGVLEFVEAARALKTEGCAARFVLVGSPDPQNPASIAEAQLRSWQREQVVEWWGHRTDMPSVLSQAHVVCLPSYREGLPKALLEAAACGRPIVATDVPGCREIVRHGINGLLVPARNARSLADALSILIASRDQRVAMGAMGRKIVLAEFSEVKIAEETLRVYDNLLGRQSRQPSICGNSR